MYRIFFTFVACCWFASAALAEDGPSVKCPSPNGRFAMRITPPKDEQSLEQEVELIEKSSGIHITSLGTASSNHLDETILVWSDDSKWVAYGTRVDKEGETDVYVWNGSDFETLTLPEKLPEVDIHFSKHANGGVKNYGGAVAPVRWLKPGVLELSSDQTMMAHDNDRTYFGIVKFTVAFDAKHHASVKKIGKTQTKID